MKEEEFGTNFCNWKGGVRNVPEILLFDCILAQASVMIMQYPLHSPEIMNQLDEMMNLGCS
jgi:hypothetical protein